MTERVQVATASLARTTHRWWAVAFAVVGLIVGYALFLRTANVSLASTAPRCPVADCADGSCGG